MKQIYVRDNWTFGLIGLVGLYNLDRVLRFWQGEGSPWNLLYLVFLLYLYFFVPVGPEDYKKTGFFNSGVFAHKLVPLFSADFLLRYRYLGFLGFLTILSWALLYPEKLAALRGEASLWVLRDLGWLAFFVFWWPVKGSAGEKARWVPPFK